MGLGLGLGLGLGRALEVTEQHTGDRYVTHLIRVRVRIRVRMKFVG